MTSVPARAWPAPSRGTPDEDVEWQGFELPGLVRIRLVGADRGQTAVVAGQLGLEPRPLSGDADITIRFVERLSLAEPVRYVGLDAGYAGDAFLVLRGRHKQRARVQVPLDAVGGACEITCERGVSAVPLLLAIVNLTVLGKGSLPVHGSAFRHRGRGVLVTGWAKGGKTEALLGFAAHGAEYVGDEWIYLDADRMRGIPEPIRLWDWHLQQMPSCWGKLPRSRRASLLALRRSSALLSWVGILGRRAARWTDRAVALLDSQRYAHVSPRDLFGAACGGEAPIDQVFLMTTRAGGPVTVGPADPDEVADRMAISIEEERAPLVSFYRRFRFAFPDRRNPLLERAAEIERERLRQFLRGKECGVVSHAYPPSISDIYAALRPVVEREGHVRPEPHWSTHTR
ncbi:MAG: hypothetical protein EHM24_24445 [Acidobacteria bacterium]|nr:MAG: hypothetical protein EHM24_24445 [Acidobacteriota bacterium]